MSQIQNYIGAPANRPQVGRQGGRQTNYHGLSHRSKRFIKIAKAWGLDGAEEIQKLHKILNKGKLGEWDERAVRREINRLQRNRPMTIGDVVFDGIMDGSIHPPQSLYEDLRGAGFRFPSIPEKSLIADKKSDRWGDRHKRAGHRKGVVRVKVQPWFAKKVLGKEVWEGMFHHETKKSLLIGNEWIPKSVITEVESFQSGLEWTPSNGMGVA